LGLSYIEKNFGDNWNIKYDIKSWSMHDIAKYVEGGHLKLWPS